MVVSLRRLGILAAVGLLLSALLVAGCTSDPSTRSSALSINPDVTWLPDSGATSSTTPSSSTSTSTSISTTYTSDGPATTAGETHRVITGFRSIEPRLALYWESLGGGDFPSDTAQAVTLQLGFSPSGALDSLFVVAYAPDTRQLLTAEAFGPPSEYIEISGAVVDGVSMDVQAATVVSYLTAIELVGRETMLAQLPALSEPSLGTYPGYYLLEAWPRAGGEEDVPSDAKALVWDGSAFQPLDAGDSRRQADPGYVRFVMTPIPAVWSIPALPPGQQTTTTEGIDTSPVCFVIPLGADSAQKETSTTIFGALNAGPQSSFFFGLSADGYVAYKMYGVKEGDTMVTLVGVRVDTDMETWATYDAIYDHATTSAKQYSIATDKRELLRVVLVEATPEQKIIESRDFDLTSTEDG
jgi:hypothetical protein